MTPRIVAMSTRFADQYPAIAAYLEKAWEGIAMTITRFGCKRLIYLIIFLITWFGTGKTDERIRLWTKVSSSYLWKIEGSLLFIHDEMLSLQLIESITESHIVVAHIEGNRHRLLLAVDVGYMKLVGMIIYMRYLGGAEVITLLHLCLFLTLVSQALTKIAHIGKETELRFLHHSLTSIVDGIIEFAIAVFHHDIQLTVRRTDGILFGIGADASY